MSKLMSAASSRGHEAVHKLFEAGGPVLVEVRVPGGVSRRTGTCASRTTSSTVCSNSWTRTPSCTSAGCGT